MACRFHFDQLDLVVLREVSLLFDAARGRMRDVCSEMWSSQRDRSRHHRIMVTLAERRYLRRRRSAFAGIGSKR